MKLPPLNALKAFEASARSGSFVLAARELGVTAAAVSLQVRNLENFFNKKLFTRSNNRIQLTDAGLAIYQDAAQALNEIAGFTARLLNSEQRALLTISIVPSLAERWLAPELADFLRSEADMSVNVRIEDDPVDFTRHAIDLRITFGEHFYPGYQATFLFQDEIVPLLHPDWVGQDTVAGSIANLTDQQLIHVDWGESFATHLGWSEWFHQFGYARQPDMRCGIKAANTSFAVAMVAQGSGAVLVQKRLVANELTAGSLMTAPDLSLKLPRPYVAVCPPRNDRYRQRFLDWLTTVSVAE